MQVENKTHKEKSLADRLPELSASEKELAISHGPLSWALTLLSENFTGLVETLPEYGLILQNVSTKLVRCVMVVDHPDCFSTLEKMRATFRHLDAELEFGPFTVIRPVGEGSGATESGEHVDGSSGPTVSAVEEIGMEVA